MWTTVPFRVAFVGSSSSGKSFLINSLLEASSQSEEDYSKLCSSRKESCAKDSYQNKTSYSFEENDSDLHSGSFSIGTPSERNYESHTNYEFESVDPNEHLFSGNSLDSNIEALTPEETFVNSTIWEEQVCPHSIFREIADAHSFLLPQNLEGMKENFTIDVSFGYPCEMTIETKSAASDAEMDTDIWGKKFKFQGLGKNLIHDRVFLREKLIEFTENFDSAISKVSMKFPSSLLDRDVEWHELDLHTNENLSEYDIVVILIQKSNISQVTKALSNQNLKGQILFIEMNEKDELEYPSQVLHEDIKLKETTLTKTMTQQLDLPSTAHPLSIIVRPSLWGLIKHHSIPILPQYVDLVLQKTGIPSLLSLLLRKDDHVGDLQMQEPLEPVIQVRNSPVKGPSFVPTTSNPKLFPTKNSTTFQSSTSSKNEKINLLSDKQTKPILSERTKILTLTEKFCNQISKWKSILQSQVLLLDQLLIKKITTLWNLQKKDFSFHKTQETHNDVMNDSSSSLALFDLAQLHWEKSVGELVVKDSAALLDFSRKVLSECVSSLSVQQPQDKIQSLTKFCQQTQSKIQEKLKNFEQQIKLKIDTKQTLPNFKKKIPQEIQVEIATFIQLFFAEKLQKDLEAIESIEKDLRRAISSMLLLGSKPSSSPLQMTSSSSSHHVSSMETSQSVSLKSKLENLKTPIHEADMPNLSELSLGKRKFLGNETDHFQVPGMEMTPVGAVDNAIYRALALQVYGEENCYPVIKILLTETSPDLSDDASQILKQFSIVYQSTVIVYSRNSTQAPFILHPPTSIESMSTYRIGIQQNVDDETTSFWSIQEKNHNKRQNMMSRRPSVVTKALSSLKTQNQSIRKDSLLRICLSKVHDLAEHLPPLQGAIPEHLVQQIIWRLIKSKSLHDNILVKLVDEDTKHLSLEGHTLNLATLQITCASAPNLESLSLANCLNIRNPQILFISEKLKHLHTLDLSGCSSVRDSGIQALCRSNPSLMCLYLENCINVSDFAVKEVLMICKSLVKLVLKSCRQLSDKAFLFLAPSSLQWLDLTEVDQITSVGISQIVSYCRHLTTLKLTATGLSDTLLSTFLQSSAANLTDLELHNAVQLTETSLSALPVHTLKTLSVTNNNHVTGNFLNRFKNSSMSLLQLDISRCFNIDSNSLISIIGSKNLFSLNLSGLENISENSLVSIATNCKQLSDLNLAKTNVSDNILENVVLRLPNLTSVCLFGCQYLTDDGILALAKWCPKLTDLDISNTKNISEKSLDHVFTRCKLKAFNGSECNLSQTALDSIAKLQSHLKKLKLGYSPQLTETTLKLIMTFCQNIKLLDISYCINVNPEIFQNARKYWQKLEELILKGTSLKNVGFSHPNLKTLDLSWCKQLNDVSLQEIAFGCKQLVHIDLSWSSLLTFTSIQKLFHLQSLNFINIRGCSQIDLSLLKSNYRSDVIVYR